MKKRRSKTERVRRRKEYLFEKFPYCPMCGVKMVLNKKGENIHPDNLVTIEHERNRYNPTRKEPQTKKEKLKASLLREGRTHLLCKKCNSGIADDETKLRPKEDLWERSGAYLLGHLKQRDFKNKGMICHGKTTHPIDAECKSCDETRKEFRKVELSLRLDAILSMRFGDGTGKNLQIGLAKKELLSMFNCEFAEREKEWINKLIDKFNNAQEKLKQPLTMALLKQIIFEAKMEFISNYKIKGE